MSSRLLRLSSMPCASEPHLVQLPVPGGELRLELSVPLPPLVEKLRGAREDSLVGKRDVSSASGGSLHEKTL